MVSQKEGVFGAVLAFCEEHNIPFEAGQKFSPSKEQTKTIVEMVARAMEAGEIALKPEAAAKYNDFEKLKGYCNGLVSNWLRKDLRLNGGDKYETKNPGSRAGSGDQTIRELKKLRKTLTEQAHIEAVDAEIEKRLTELNAHKAKSVEINADLIPEELRDLIPA